jgi:hypothetical protein
MLIMDMSAAAPASVDWLAPAPPEAPAFFAAATFLR